MRSERVCACERGGKIQQRCTYPDIGEKQDMHDFSPATIGTTFKDVTKQ